MRTKRNTKELRLRKEIAELRSQIYEISHAFYSDGSNKWHEFYSKYGETPEYRQLVKLVCRMMELQEGVDNL